jgi:hypothetical protein
MNHMYAWITCASTMIDCVPGRQATQATLHAPHATHLSQAPSAVKLHLVLLLHRGPAENMHRFCT